MESFNLLRCFRFLVCSVSTTDAAFCTCVPLYVDMFRLLIMLLFNNSIVEGATTVAHRTVAVLKVVSHSIFLIIFRDCLVHLSDNNANKNNYYLPFFVPDDLGH